MTITYSSTIDCREIHNSIKEGINAGRGIAASVRLECAFSDRWTLAQELIDTPGEWPYTPAGATAPIVQNVQILRIPETYVEDGQGSTYSVANLEVTYGFSSGTGGSSGGGVGSSSRNIFEDVLEPIYNYRSVGDTAFFHLADDGVTEYYLPNQSLPTLKEFQLLITRTYHNWQFVPDSFWELGGTVNEEDVNVSSYGKIFPAETLLFIPKSAGIGYYSGGTQGWTVSVQFQYQKQRWNKWYYVDIGDDGITVPGEGSYKPLYYKKFLGAIGGSTTNVRWTPHPSADFQGWLF